MQQVTAFYHCNLFRLKLNLLILFIDCHMFVVMLVVERIWKIIYTERIISMCKRDVICMLYRGWLFEARMKEVIQEWHNFVKLIIN